MRGVVAALVVGFGLSLSSAGASTLDITAMDSSIAAKNLTTGKAAKRSPVSFTAVSPLTVGATSPFALGTLFRTKTGGNKAATLDLSLSGIAGSASFGLDLIYQIAKGETGGCNLSAPQCAGAMSITTIQGGSVSVRSGKFIYDIVVDGFVQALGGPVVSWLPAFRNGGSKGLILQGSVTVSQVPPSPVPVPAGGLLLAAALGAVGLMRRKRA